MFQVLAPISTATTSFMSFLNTSSSVAHYLVLGDVPFGYGGAVFVVGAFGKSSNIWQICIMLSLWESIVAWLLFVGNGTCNICEANAVRI